MLRCNTYLNMQDNLLAFYGDDIDHELYTKIFGFMLPSGVIFVPLIDWSIDRLGLGGTLHFTNFIRIIGVLSLIPSLQVNLGAFFFFTMFRAFLYASMSTFNAQVFGLRTLGRMTGFVFTSSAIFGLAQYPSSVTLRS